MFLVVRMLCAFLTADDITFVGFDPDTEITKNPGRYSARVFSTCFAAPSDAGDMRYTPAQP
jgi:hypothetical protein